MFTSKISFYAKGRNKAKIKIKKKYKTILNTLAGGKRKGLTKEEKRVLRLWPKNVTNKELARAKKRLRFQLGQADKFKAGLIRSGSWKPYILKTLNEMGLPRELAALPHVESSFNYKAYSKVGAAGMWQFTRPTGRRYMRVDHVLDERLDPFIATISAAQLLKNNYSVTGSWPLAITAYNHGAAGMRRAAKKFGSKDIALIIQKYKSRSFGFASRNFYTSFLAASDIDRNPGKYFKNIQLNPPVAYEFVNLPAYIGVDTVLEAFNLDKSAFMDANPALRAAVLNGDKYIPKSYELRIDRTSDDGSTKRAAEIIASIEPERLHQKQIKDRYHRVRKGQTLSIIAARYGLRVRDLVAANNMRNKHHIRIGQVLVLPQKKRKKTAPEVVVHEKKSPKTEPLALPEDGIYIVKQGDNIDRIARKNAISIKKLLRLNKLSDKNKIYPGQKLALIKQEEITAQISKQKNIQLAQLAKSSSSPEQEAPELVAPVLGKEESKTATDEPVDKTIPDEVIDSEDEAMLNNMQESIGDNVIKEGQTGALSSELQADPSDYSVGEQSTIEIQAAETLGHYAEWLQIRASDLRRLNRIRYGKPVLVGKRLKLNFSKVTPDEFEARRIAYHKVLQEEFFEQNQIIGSDKYRLSRGQSVWKLTQKTYKIPFWLLRQYNPDLDMNRIRPDKIIYFPKVKRRSIEES
ncbi:MAG: LysM peptidoglycan-binding domain-containing protein [Gammaproteobacteria bacterium]|nr:LysM peptidoglycan-binding domain-containing protein [Gammaproteobacteria bacterium]